MIITNKTKSDKTKDRIVDLTGQAGNAYNLIGLACNLCDQLKWTNSEKNEIVKDMRSKDYRHLIDTFDLHFGDIYDLYATEFYLERCNLPRSI